MRVVVADVAAVVGATAFAHAQFDGEAVLAAACEAHADARTAAAVGALLCPGVLARLQADGVVGGQVDGVARGDGGADGADVRLRLPPVATMLTLFAPTMLEPTASLACVVLWLSLLLRLTLTLTL